MRLTTYALGCLALATSGLAQGPNAVPINNPAPPPASAAAPGSLREKADKAFALGKRLVQVYLGNTPIDYEGRAKSDEAAGVLRLTDENWDREMAAWDGDWAIILHGNLDGGIAVPDPASTYFVSMHNNATILANTYMNSPNPLDTDDKDRDLKLSNLRKVKWARFDYITEWEMCARWMVTRPPWLLFVSDHGKELRFLGTRSISPEGKKLFSFMAYRNWETLTTWKPIPFYSKCAEFYINTSHRISSLTTDVPRWVWLFIVPAITQGLIKYMFFGAGTPAPARTPGGARPVPRAAGARAVPVAKKNA